MIFSDLYNDIPIGVCILKIGALTLDVVYANPAMAGMLGRRAAEDLSGLNIEALWPGQDMADLAKKLRSPSPPASVTIPFDDVSTGRRRWTLLSIQKTQQNGQNVVILWAADISTSKEAEESLQHAVEQADALSEQKSNFLATMSHEIRTPMQSVYGLLELIEIENPPENVLTMAHTAKQSASGLLEILDDILDFAKMDSDKMELDLFEVPVRMLVRGILEAMAVKVQGKDIAMIDDIAEDVPFVILGDPKRLRQIIINLTGNALKFTDHGSVTIRVSASPQVIEAPKSGLALRFEIIDTGIGMGEAVASRLFQAFTQADSSTSRKYGGTGLGLSICKKLVELMGGQIGVTSIEGQGSTFWFEIPTEDVGTETNILKLPKLEGISVLSVEDHPQGAKEIVKSMESMGANVENCPTCKEALELVRRRPFDVGIIDQGLPDGLGLDLIREIMEIRPFMGLIMYTVRNDAGLQHSLQSLGVAYLTKPASRIGLGEAVSDAASKARRLNITGPKKLLIAEDTESVRDVLSRQLKKLGVEATFVTNGKDALEAVKTGEYGILFTDLHMPEMDGYGVVKAIREGEKDASNNSHYPVIALTADIQMSQRQVYLSHGFDECLLKPVSLGQFRRLLTRWGLLEADAQQDNSQDEEQERKKDKHRPPAGATAEGQTQELDQKKEQEQKQDRQGPAIDKSAIEQLMGGFDADTIEMLGMFVDMTAPLIEKLKTAQANDDSHDLTETAHSLKGAARSACANILGDLSARLQEDAAGQKPCADLVHEIALEFERVREEIQNLSGKKSG